MDDLISRQAAIGRAVELPLFGKQVKVVAVSELEALPSVQPDRKKGTWVPVANGRGGHECDQCHNYAPSYSTGEEHLSDYCPNCGAKMDEKEKTNESD